MKPIRVGAVQMESALGDVAHNVRQMRHWMTQAQEQGVQLVCFPEACLTGYTSTRAQEVALPFGSEQVKAVLQMATDCALAVSFGFVEFHADSLPTVTHVVYDGRASLAKAESPGLFVYRKTHLGRSEVEAFAPGERLLVGQIPEAVFGVQLCWESHFPDISTTLRGLGAEVLLVPFASPVGGQRRCVTWERYLAARAYDNGAFVVAANALSRDATGNARGGGIAVFDPEGVCLSSSYGDEPALVVYDLDGHLPRNVPTTGMRGASYFDYRREELYGSRRTGEQRREECDAASSTQREEANDAQCKEVGSTAGGAQQKETDGIAEGAQRKENGVSQHREADGVRRTCVVVGITGGSGSGKTVFAERLLKRLGADAVALSHDDYYKHLPNMTAQEADVYDFDSPDALETNLLVEHLHMLKAGKPVWVPAYDFASHARIESARRIELASIILVEGLLIMCDPDLLAMCDLTVFVDAEPDMRILRRIIRDCNERGADLQRAADMYLKFSKPAHERYVEPFKESADIVVLDALDDACLETVVSRISCILA